MAEKIVDEPTHEGKKPKARFGVIGWVRWFWRQLTSMRTALFLLLLVAVAAVPGSIFPQRSINPDLVTKYQEDHPSAFPTLDKLGMFNVYSTPWFAAIYILLAISLVGCILPRVKVHWQAMRMGPPKMPSNILRLPATSEADVDGTPDEVMARATKVLRSRRFKLRKDVGEHEISAEGGMLRETGNLLFHMSLVGIIVSVALGHLLGWRGDVIVSEGDGFSSTMTRYDTLQLGPWVNADDDIPDWSLKMKKLNVTFERNVDPSSPQWGQPRDFTAKVHYKESPKAKWKNDTISVNHPLKVGGGEVYLLGNGYAPKVTVKDAKGEVIYDQATPFLSMNNQYKSTGAIKIPGAEPKQMGLFGFFLPTAYVDPQMGPSSAFPDKFAPELYLGVYTGDLYPGGRPQSVWSLDTQNMTQVKDTNGQPLRLRIRMGQTVKLPNNLGTVTLDSVPRWAGLSIRHDPGKTPALVFALLALGGLVLSLTIRRRRIFVRVLPAEAGPDGKPRTLVEMGGLAKGEDPRLQVAVHDLMHRIGGPKVTSTTKTKDDA